MVGVAVVFDPSICLSASLRTKRFCETSSIFELDNVKNAAILWDFLNFWSWQRQKRSSSETSSIFQVGKIKNETILRDFLQEWNVECSLPMRFPIFPPHLSKVHRLPPKSDARSYEVLHLSRKIIFPKLTIWCSKMQLLSGNLRPDPLTHVSCTAPVTRNPSFQILFKCPTPAIPFETATKPSCFAHFWQGAQSWRLPRKTTSEHPKVLRTPQFFALLTSKCALRHNGVHFSTSQLPKVLCTWCVLYILTWKCASRRDGVQLVISHVARWPRTRRFSEPTFGPSRATNHWKNTLFRSFPTFSCTWIFFLLRLSLCWSSFFFLLLFFSSLLFSSLLWLFPSLLFICPCWRKFDF